MAEPGGWVLGLSVSSDGGHLVYGLFGYSRVDLMLVENSE